MGGADQEQLTAEEKDEQIIKNLNSNNPQAAHNLVQFSYRDRIFKGEQNVDHMVFHVNMDGCILQTESDDMRDQLDYWDTKKNLQKQLLSTMNKEVNNMEGGDPRKYHLLVNLIIYSAKRPTCYLEVTEESVQLLDEIFPDFQHANQR